MRLDVHQHRLELAADGVERDVPVAHRPHALGLVKNVEDLVLAAPLDAVLHAVVHDLGEPTVAIEATLQVLDRHLVHADDVAPDRVVLACPLDEGRQGQLGALEGIANARVPHLCGRRLVIVKVGGETREAEPLLLELVPVLVLENDRELHPKRAIVPPMLGEQMQVLDGHLGRVDLVDGMGQHLLVVLARYRCGILVLLLLFLGSARCLLRGGLGGRGHGGRGGCYDIGWFLVVIAEHRQCEGIRYAVLVVLVVIGHARHDEKLLVAVEVLYDVVRKRNIGVVREKDPPVDGEGALAAIDATQQLLGGLVRAPIKLLGAVHSVQHGRDQRVFLNLVVGHPGTERHLELSFLLGIRTVTVAGDDARRDATRLGLEDALDLELEAG